VRAFTADPVYAARVVSVFVTVSEVMGQVPMVKRPEAVAVQEYQSEVVAPPIKLGSPVSPVIPAVVPAILPEEPLKIVPGNVSLAHAPAAAANNATQIATSHLKNHTYITQTQKAAA